MTEHDVYFAKGMLVVRHQPGRNAKSAAPMAQERTTKTLGRHWTIPASDSPTVVDWADQNQVSVAPEVREYADDLWQRELASMRLCTLSSLPREEWATVEGLTSTLLPTQQPVVAAATKAWTNTPDVAKSHRGLLVADEPGLGKTLESLAAVRAEGARSERVVIVCPTGLTENWLAEMVEHFELGTFSAFVAQGTTPEDIPEGIDTVVVGWGAVLVAWTEVLEKWKPDALIADEGHYAKSGRQRTKKKTTAVKGEGGKFARDEHGNVVLEEKQTTVSGSARASAVLKLGSSVARRSGLVMALTGTPIVNRPVELEPLLDLIGVIVQFGGAVSYKERFCGPTTKSTGSGRTTREYKGSSNLLELNARLSASGHYVRRTKQLLIDAGLLQRKIVDGVDYYDYTQRPSPWMIEATAEEMAEYRKVEEELSDFFADHAKEFVANSTRQVSSARVEKEIRAEGARQLQRIAALRQEAAKVKAKYIIAKVREMNDRGERVVIAAHHRDIVNLYADAFSGLKIQGAMSVPEIERAKAQFNSGTVEEHPVLVLSVEAGKTGHTLCKQNLHGVGPSCAYMVFAEQVWTPGDETQAQDRIWRIGQEREVRIINALLPSSVDMSMYGQRQKKRQIVNAAVDAVDVKDVETEKDGAGLIALQLAMPRLRKAA